MSKFERFASESSLFGPNGFFPALPASLFARNNAIGVALMAMLPVAGGSAITGLLAVYFFWGIVSLVLRRFPMHFEPSDWMPVLAFSAYWLLVVVTGLFGANRSELWPIALQLLPFLALWTQIPRLRAAEGVDYLQFTIAGAAFGAMAGALGGIYQTWMGLRPEVMAGNAAIYAMLSLAMGGLAALNIDSEVPRRRWLAVAGLVAGLVCVVLSLTRGVWLASLPVLAVLLIYAPRRWVPPLKRLPALSALAVVLAAVAVLAAPILVALYYSTVDAFSRLELGDFTTSPGQRVRMYLATAQAFVDSPFWGYGIQNRMDVVIAHYPPGSLKVKFYTHLHNGFFSAVIDGGVVMLTALVAMLLSPIIAVERGARDPGYRKRLFAAIVLVLSYALCGLTQIMFKHDILDAFFIFTTAVIVASVPRKVARTTT